MGVQATMVMVHWTTCSGHVRDTSAGDTRTENDPLESGRHIVGNYQYEILISTHN